MVCARGQTARLFVACAVPYACLSVERLVVCENGKSFDGCFASSPPAHLDPTLALDGVRGVPKAVSIEGGRCYDGGTKYQETREVSKSHTPRQHPPSL